MRQVGTGSFVSFRETSTRSSAGDGDDDDDDYSTLKSCQPRGKREHECRRLASRIGTLPSKPVHTTSNRYQSRFPANLPFLSLFLYHRFSLLFRSLHLHPFLSFASSVSSPFRDNVRTILFITRTGRCVTERNYYRTTFLPIEL